MKRDIVLESLMGVDNPSDNLCKIVEEIQSIENREILLEVDKSLGAGSLGCSYRKGAFMIDFNGNVIYKQFFPSYFTFLRQWFLLETFKTSDN